MKHIVHPLMDNNITREDINEVVSFLSQDPIPQLTNGPKVREFESEWSKWLGTKYSLFVNSGSAANQLTMMAYRYLYGHGEIIVPPLTWVSDIASVMQAGQTPKFVDINLKNLSFDVDKLKKAINPSTKAIFLTHVLGINGLTDDVVNLCLDKGIPLIEDVCESHGATFKGQKVGSLGFASNFSFYFAHHMSTIEGGMICTDDEEFYQHLRCFRSHGMLRESTSEQLKTNVIAQNPDLNPDFIFLAPAFNFRSTEINAVLGLNQLKNLDANNNKRKENFAYFMEALNPDRYHTDLEMEGQCNYAFIVILKNATLENRTLVEKALREYGVEFRRGLSGGGNQLRQPYMRFRPDLKFKLEDFENIEKVHNCSWYIGNYPSLPKNKIDNLLRVLNSIELS